MTSRFGNAITVYFGLKEKGSNIRTEVMAGASTFLVLSYIFFVNPAILADAGMDKTADEQTLVRLTGLGTDLDGMVEGYLWEQMEGTTVNLTAVGNNIAEFSSPVTTTGEVLKFRLTVTDNAQLTGTDIVEITVTPVNAPLA